MELILFLALLDTDRELGLGVELEGCRTPGFSDPRCPRLHEPDARAVTLDGCRGAGGSFAPTGDRHEERGGEDRSAPSRAFR